jgi:ectoine hydroxylase-related dioxygenase (phytanoyl-CoA dioxygenase family)
VAEQCQLEWTNREGRQRFCIKKGDVVIWHQWMVHGGSPVNDPVRTRQSLISHWTANNSVAFDQHNYFLNYGRLDDKLAMPLPVQDTTDGCYLKQKSHIISWVPPETFINTVETA